MVSHHFAHFAICNVIKYEQSLHFKEYLHMKTFLENNLSQKVLHTSEIFELLEKGRLILMQHF